MHEEATSMSVPSSVAASTSQNENGTTPTVSVVTADVELDVTVEENVDIQVPFSSNSGGKFQNLNLCQPMIYRLLSHSLLMHSCVPQTCFQRKFKSRRLLLSMTPIYACSLFMPVSLFVIQFLRDCAKVNLKGK